MDNNKLPLGENGESTDTPITDQSISNVESPTEGTASAATAVKTTCNITAKFNLFYVIILAILGVYMLVTFIGGFNMLTMVSAILGAVFALVIAITAAMKKPLSIYLIGCFGLSMFTASFFYVIWGVYNFFANFGIFLLLMLPTSLIIGGIFLSDKFIRNITKQEITKIVLSFTLIATCVVYILTMQLTMRANVERMWEGHDEYLASISGKKKANSPNILLVVMDDMGYADIGKYCYRKDGVPIINTPNIDSIADMGVMFENFYASSPVCSPSRTGLLTGRYPCRSHMDNVQFPTDLSVAPFNYFRYVDPFELPHGVDGMLGDEITIAEALGSSGYRTGAFGKWHIGDYGEYLPNNQGFDYFFGSRHVNDVPNYQFHRNNELVVNGREMDQRKTNRTLTDEVKGFIERETTANDDPLFMYYASPWPHAPISCGEDAKGISSAGTYGDCIEEFDSGLGEIFATLKEKGIFEDTIIMFTSDNGPGKEGAAGAHRGRKNTTFEGGHKVPFLVSYPNGVKHSEKPITSRVTNLDLFPTLLEYAGVPSLPTDRIIDGKPINKLIGGEIAPDSIIHEYFYYMKRGKLEAIQYNFNDEVKARTYKYYKNVSTENLAFAGQFYKNYIFDLNRDPSEAYNISMNNPELLKKMQDDYARISKELTHNRRGILK